MKYIRMKNRTTIINFLITIISLVISLFVLEFFLRIYKGEYHFKNFLAEEGTLFTAGYPSQYDFELGWIPKEGASSKKNRWGTEVTIKEHGIRSNGKEELSFSSNSVPILAVGDSFTFGDQVSDWETWPAILETLLKKKVINAGVFGYGIDQTYLRAERLIKIFKPACLIFSFLPMDINRCELSKRTAVEKPYFAVVGNQLRLKNIPVPEASQTNIVGNCRHILGYSYFIHKVMMKTSPGYWLKGKNWTRRTKVHSDGIKVACLLFLKLKELAEVNNIKVYILVQYTEDLGGSDMVDNVFDCIKNQSIGEIIDLRFGLFDLKQQDKNKYKRLFQGHMTHEGNYWVALKLQGVIKGIAIND